MSQVTDSEEMDAEQVKLEDQVQQLSGNIETIDISVLSPPRGNNARNAWFKSWPQVVCVDEG